MEAGQCTNLFVQNTMRLQQALEQNNAFRVILLDNVI